MVHFDSSANQPTYKITLGFYALSQKKTRGCIINYCKTAQECMQLKIAEMAKSALLDSNLSTKQVAEMLVSQYPQHFLRFFKKQVGCTPKEFMNNAVA